MTGIFLCNVELDLKTHQNIVKLAKLDAWWERDLAVCSHDHEIKILRECLHK